MKLQRKRELKAQIPTASMSDIAFLLIIFFMTVTVFRKAKGLPVKLPHAKTTERILKQRDLAFIWISKNGKISVDDNIVPPEKVALLFRSKISENPALIVSLKADQNVKYRYVYKVMEALREANALRVVFATKKGE
ncbi:MAG: biopolymer transporter ExbD [Thermotogae bacterium]|nr:biopolymer transporter ExbD [Thermotogota bacterium]